MIRILLVDDQSLVRQGIQALLETRTKLQVVGTTEDGNDAIEQVKTLKPDVVLIDIEMPGMSGITATHRICQQFPLTKVIVLSSHENREYIIQSFQAGAVGYLPKSTLADDLEQAIRSVYRGHLHPELKLLKKVLTGASLSQSITSEDQNKHTLVNKKSSREALIESHSNFNNISNVNDKYLQEAKENVKIGEKQSLPKISKNTLKAVFGRLEFKNKKNTDRSKKIFEQVEFPSVQNNKVKWLWLFLSLAILCGSSICFLWLKRNNASVSTENQSSPVIPVKIQQLEASIIENSSELIGTLEAQKKVSLRPETDGRIVEILVGSGKKVTQGTSLIQLRSDKNRAQLDSAIARINSLKAAINRAGSELRVAKAEQSGQLAELELQEEELKRTSFLVTEGAQSPQNLDQVRRDRQAALATFEAAQERVKTTEAKIGEANADLQQAEADANLERENLRDTEVVAPIAGTVGNIPVKIGDYVETSDIIATITQNQNLELRLAIPINYSTRLRIGLPVELRTLQGGNSLVVGEISFISPKVDTTSQSVLVKAHFPNPQRKLRDQQFVRAKIIWEQKSGVLVPASAVTRLGNQAFVFVAENLKTSQSGAPQQIAKQKPVKLGNIQENYYQVIEGVTPGENIVTSGLLKLSNGTLIMPELNNSLPKAL